MTVQTNTTVATGIGNGVTSVFPIPFKFNRAEDLYAILIDSETQEFQELTLDSDYTVSGVGREEGGAVTTTIPVPAGKIIKVFRIIDLLQKTDLRNQGKFFAEIHEDLFDRIVMMVQQLQEQLDRAVKVPPNSDTPADELYAEFKQDVADAEAAARESEVARDESRDIAEKFGDVDGAVTAAEQARDAAGAHAWSAGLNAGRSEAAADRSEAARDAAAANADVYPNVATGINNTSDTEQFQVLSADGTELIRYRNDSGVGVEVARFPSSAYLRGVSRDEAFRYGQPNQFSVEQLALETPSVFSGSLSAVFSIDNLGGRKVLRVDDGSMVERFPADVFREHGTASASVWVERLTGATTVSRLRLLQVDAGGAAINYAESFFGSSDFSSPRQFFVRGLAVHPDAAEIHFIVQTSATTGSSVWIRDFCVCAGNDWRFRDVSQRAVAQYVMDEGGVLSDGDLDVVPSSNLASPELLIDGQYVANAGQIVSAPGWQMLRVPAVPGATYTFGNFQIVTAGYSSFVGKDNSVIQFNGQYTTSSLPVTVTAPPGESFLCITVARPTNEESDYQFLTLNMGPELLPYEAPTGTVVAIKGNKIAGDVNPEDYARIGFDASFADVVASSISASALILNLPSGASMPPDVELHQAWIDETDSSIKVRLS